MCRFGHGATDTLAKAAERARRLLTGAIDAMEKEKDKLRQETDEVRLSNDTTEKSFGLTSVHSQEEHCSWQVLLGLFEIPPSFFGDFPT